METKSRYEVIAELQTEKNNLIKERESFKDKIKLKKKSIREMERDIEDSKEDLEEFEKSVEERKTTINELIKSLDESLQRFENLSKSQKK